MTCNIEEWSDEIIFRHELSLDERKAIKNICYANIFNQGHNEIIDFLPIFDTLKEFFISQPGNYFIRLSTRSPKDVWYQLYCNNEIKEINSDYTLESVKRDLTCLKCFSAEHCLQILSNSGRVYEDMDLENSVILLPWKEINYITETRCFIIDGTLKCFSQYYNIDPPDVTKINKLILAFFQTYSPPYISCVVDVHSPDYNRIELIEINPSNNDTETGYFTWEEIYSINPIEYRYQGGKINNQHLLI